MDQLSMLTSLLNNKEVSGTYKGVEFKGQVVEIYPKALRIGRSPISFSVKLSGTDEIVEYYSSDTRQDHGAILQLKKVAFNKSKKNSK